jgi:hypothetical protein
MADKEQIGLTPAGNSIMRRVLASGFFAGKNDVARLAAALAMDAGHPAAAVKGTDTTWHTKGLDSTGELQTAVMLNYPGTTEPYRMLEGLIDAGLRRIEQHLDSRGEIVLPELLQTTPSAEG